MSAAARLAAALAGIAVFLPIVARAVETDLGVTAVARGKTPAFLAEAQGGISQVAWGDPAANPIFGYVRASGAARSAGVANGYRAQLELYPVSFLGATFGTQGLHRSVDAPEVDCERYECRGWVRSRYLQARGVFGRAGAFAQIQWQRDFFAERGLNRPLFDSMTMLPLGIGDRADTWLAIAGYSFLPDWSAGGLWLRADSRRSDAEAANLAAFLRRKSGDFTYTLALGRVDATLTGVGPQGLLTVAWWPKARVGF